MIPFESAPWEPRAWQLKAVQAWLATDSNAPVIRAVTGAGKSVLIAEAAYLTEGKVVVTTPTVKLVGQLASTLRSRGLDVGTFFTGSKQTENEVVVVCNDSLAKLSTHIEPPALWIVDECHKSENPQIHDVILGPEGDDAAAWTPVKTLGLTATPYRSSDREKLSLFDKLIYDYGPAEAIRDGVVVRPRARQYTGKATTIDDACIEMIRAQKGPGLVDSINIKDAREFADLLTFEGIKALPVHSKLDKYSIDRRIERLEKGEIDVLVHVNLLSEGVDLPWLRWLCCRRPIGSKVLFAQYVGRGLRKHDAYEWKGEILPAKKYCDILDPNDLFGKLSLDYKAVLSGDLEDEDTIPDLPALELDWIIDEVRDDINSDVHMQTLRGVPLAVVDPAVAFVRRLNLAFQCMGKTSMKMRSRDWRTADPSQKQFGKLYKDLWVIDEPEIPTHQQRALRIAAKASKAFDRGTMSDFLAILEALKWGWPEEETI